MQNFSQYLTCRSMLAKKQGKGFSETETKEILRQVLAQLNTLHERRQSHGSISLDTIAYDQRRMMIVLLPSNGRNNPIYLAPEVVQTRQATPTADIYAVAIVMIVLLTGMPPEELKTATDMWNWEERCNVSDRFIQILNIALSATRDFRYVNAGQMIRSLKPIIAIPEPKVDLNRLNPVGNSIAASSLQDEHSDPTVAEASQYLEPIDPNRLNTISSKKTPYIAFTNGSNGSKSIGSTTNSTANSTDIKANTSANSQFNSLDILGKSQGDVSQNDFCAFQLPFSSGDDSEDIQNDDLSQKEVSKTNKAGIAKATVYGGMESSKNGSLLSLENKGESIESIPTSKFRLIIALIFAVGVIAGGLLSFLLLSRFSDPNKNLQFISAADLDKAIARVYESKKAEENIDKLLVLAKYKYEYSGNLSEAETMLQSIPSDLASRAKADQLLVQWQEDVKQNTAIIKDAEQALKNGNWQSAIDMVKSISPTPYWQDRGKAIAEDAKQRLAGTNTRTNTTNNTSANPSTNTSAVATVEAAREATRDNPPSTSDSQFYSPSSSENTSSGTSARTNTPPLSSPPVAEAPSPRVAPSSPPPPSPEPPVFSTPPATAAPPAPRIAN